MPRLFSPVGFLFLCYYLRWVSALAFKSVKQAANIAARAFLDGREVFPSWEWCSFLLSFSSFVLSSRSVSPLELYDRCIPFESDINYGECIFPWLNSIPRVGNVTRDTTDKNYLYTGTAAK